MATVWFSEKFSFFLSWSRSHSEDARHSHRLGLLPALCSRQLHPEHGHPDQHVRQEVPGTIRLRGRLVSCHSPGNEGLLGLRHLHQRAPLRVGAQHLELGLLQQPEHRPEDEPVSLREDPEILSHRGVPAIPGKQPGPLQDPAFPGLAAAVVQLHLQTITDTGVHTFLFFSSKHHLVFLDCMYSYFIFISTDLYYQTDAVAAASGVLVFVDFRFLLDLFAFREWPVVLQSCCQMFSLLDLTYQIVFLEKGSIWLSPLSCSQSYPICNSFHPPPAAML